MSAYREAVRRLIDDEQVCPRCGARNLQAPAKPTLEREQDGTLTCTTCGTNFHPKETR